MATQTGADGSHGGNPGHAWRRAVAQVVLGGAVVAAVTGVVFAVPRLQEGELNTEPPAHSPGGDICSAPAETPEAVLARAVAENRDLDLRAVDVFLVEDAARAAELSTAIERETFLRAVAGEPPRHRQVIVAGPDAATAWFAEAEAVEGGLLRVIDLRGAVVGGGGSQ